LGFSRGSGEALSREDFEARKKELEERSTKEKSKQNKVHNQTFVLLSLPPFILLFSPFLRFCPAQVVSINQALCWNTLPRSKKRS
jgi:hypothetical protein